MKIVKRKKDFKIVLKILICMSGTEFVFSIFKPTIFLPNEIPFDRISNIKKYKIEIKKRKL